MLRIDRSVPVRITLERVPASGNQAEVISAAMEPAHRIDAALAGNQRREGQPMLRRSSHAPTHPSPHTRLASAARSFTENASGAVTTHMWQ